MNNRNSRLALLLTITAALPVAGFLMGFSKAQTSEDDWSSSISVNHELLSPETAGILALKHEKELKLTASERDSILKLVRADGVKIQKAQRESWEERVEVARKLMSGDEIVMEFSSVPSLRRFENSPMEKAKNSHSANVQKVLGRTRSSALLKFRDASVRQLPRQELFLLLKGTKDDILRISKRQKRQFARLASYQVRVVKERKMYGFDGEFETLPLEESIKIIEKASPEQIRFFLYQAQDFLDPYQHLQLNALFRNQSYVPVP